MTLIQCCDLSLGYEGKCVLSHLELSEIGRASCRERV